MNTSLLEDIRTYIAPKKSLVKRRGSGYLRHDYLVPGGPYEEQWDWDAFFIGMALAGEIPSEAIFLRNWALNYMENADDRGYVPGCVTTKGPDPRLKQMKPLLAQGAFFASRMLNDVSWLNQGDRYQQLKTVVLYRETQGLWNSELGLGAWTDSMESGADNNLALLNEPDGSVASVDLNCFLWMEYAAMSQLAGLLGKPDEQTGFQSRADALKESILTHLWCEEDGTFYNKRFSDGSFIQVVAYSSFHPFWAGIASQKQADQFFNAYVFNESKLRSPYGIRTLTKDHSGYNNVNMIKPHSNWQGPLWPIATYIYCQSLAAYGYVQQAQKVAEQMIQVCIDDIRATGGMHENYDAETGQPLAAPNFISWNLLLLDLPRQLEQKENPFQVKLPF